MELVPFTHRYTYIPVERKEGRQLHPSVAKFLVGVTVKTTCIHSKHGYTEQCEVQRLRYRKIHVSEQACVVASPVTCTVDSLATGLVNIDALYMPPWTPLPAKVLRPMMNGLLPGNTLWDKA